MSVTNPLKKIHDGFYDGDASAGIPTCPEIGWALCTYAEMRANLFGYLQERNFPGAPSIPNMREYAVEDLNLKLTGGSEEHYLWGNVNESERLLTDFMVGPEIIVDVRFVTRKMP